MLPAPEQVAVPVCAVFHLLGGAGLYPCRVQQLAVFPPAVLQVELPKGVQLRQGEEQPARPKGVAQGVRLPGGPGDAQVLKEPRRQVGDQVAPAAPLDQHPRQIGPHVVVDEFRVGRVGKGEGEGQLHPVPLLVQGPLGAHQLPAGLAQAHGQQVPHRGVLQVFADRLRQILGKGVHQPLLQRQQSLLDGEPHRAGGDALAGGVHVPAALLVPCLVCDDLPAL